LRFRAKSTLAPTKTGRPRCVVLQHKDKANPWHQRTRSQQIVRCLRACLELEDAQEP
jgi:hypothetical protein